MGLAQAGSKVVLVNCDFRRPTTDQFFDEAQWESYRSLGYHNACSVLQATTLKSLREFMNAHQIKSPPEGHQDTSALKPEPIVEAA